MRIKLAFTLTIILVFFDYGNLLCQSWSTLIPHIKTTYDDYSIGNLHDGVFTVAGQEIIVLDKNGEIQTIRKMPPNVWRLNVLDNYVYGLENRTDSLVLTIASNDLAVMERVNIPVYNFGYPSFAIKDANSFFILKTDGELINFNRQGEIIRTKILERGQLHISDNGEIAVTQTSSSGSLLLLNSNLDTIFSVSNADLNATRVLNVKFFDDKLLFTGPRNDFTEGNEFNIGELDLSGNVKNIVTYQYPIPEPNNRFGFIVGDINANQNGIGVMVRSFEGGPEMILYCLDNHLIKQDSFYLNNGGLTSNLVNNEDQGFVFGFGESIDPMGISWETEKRPIFYSTDQSCKVNEDDGFLKGYVFNDSNKNSVLDENEEKYSSLKLLQLPDSIYTYTDDSGYYKLRLSQGVNQIQLIDENQCFSSESTINVNYDTLSFDQEYNIPLSKINEEQDLQVNLNVNRVRCGFTVPFTVTIENTGCDILHGNLEISSNELLHFVDTSDMTQEIVDLQPYQKIDIVIDFQVASEEFNDDTTKLFVSFKGTNLEIDTSFKNIITCAIDPNDKAVLPKTLSPDSIYYSVISDELFYKIRFQNLGSDTAFTIIVEDTLTELFNLNTIRPITSSHPFEFEQRGNVVTFKYSNILLPPALQNVESSNGFITFSVRLKDEISDFSIVDNKANIYFDYNKPITTNVSSIIAVETLDKDLDGYKFWEDCDDSNASINLEAEEIANNEIDENCDGTILIIDNDSDGFNSDEDCNDLDSLINPLAVEVANNTIDENCDGVALIIDNDSDGFNSDEDCDDGNAAINPDAEEIADNGIDENCDGEDLISSAVGEIENMVLKIYPNPSYEKLYIENRLNDSYALTIYRIDGTVILNRKVPKGEKLVVEELDPGLYYIIAIFENAESKINAKIVIH